MILKGGHTTKDHRLDRIPEFDEKSKQYPIRKAVVRGEVLEDKEIVSKLWSLDTWLDQGREGRCVEYGICHDLLADPEPVAQKPLVDQILETRRIYWTAQRNDAFPGGTYPGADPESEGTSVLAGVKAAHDLGFYGEYRWAFSLVGALLGLSHLGPLIIGVNWYEGLSETNDHGFIQVTGEQTGGHCILVIGGHIEAIDGFAGKIVSVDQINLDESYVLLHNSWGKSWGVEGRGKLSIPDFDRLRKEDGEVCIATQRYIPTSLPEEAA